ncbi:MAG: hypothetical protein HY617_00235 [Candidatus Sungbacteria bacterium]|nr:hypothetical protein [Candidatus Sungbacteria bacterium]
MPRHPIELAKKQYEELPALLKQALFSTEIAEIMFEIGKKFGLTIEKTGIMAEETGYIMLGLTRPNELVANLANELAVDTDKAKDIATEVNHRIFFPLREELKRAHDFDMDATQIAGSTQVTGVSGMQMPPNIKKTLVEEKSPLVSDLTRVKESPSQGGDRGEVKPLPTPTPPQHFESFASPTGRIADLQKMVARQDSSPQVEKPPLPLSTLTTGQAGDKQATPMPPVSAKTVPSVQDPIKDIQPKPEPKSDATAPDTQKSAEITIASPKKLPEIPSSFAKNTISQPQMPETTDRPAAPMTSKPPLPISLKPTGTSAKPILETSPSVAPLPKTVKPNIVVSPGKPTTVSKAEPPVVLSRASTPVERSGIEPPVVSGVEPWEKDLEKEVGSLLAKKPKESLSIDLRPQQKTTPSPVPGKLPPIDLRQTAAPQPQPKPIIAISASTEGKTQQKPDQSLADTKISDIKTETIEKQQPMPKPLHPSLPRMTPQMQDSGIGNITGPTLLEEKLHTKAQEKTTPFTSELNPVLSPKTSTTSTEQLSETSPIISAPQNTVSSDPYREPIEEESV